MTTQHRLIQATPHAVFSVLTDFGGWRMWNPKIAFAAVDGACVPHHQGMLYLRKLPWLRWHLVVDEVVDDQRLVVSCHAFGLCIQIKFMLNEVLPTQSSTAAQTEVSAVLEVIGRFASLLNPSVLPLWRGFVRSALQGLDYAASEVCANQQY
jgi:hypothetical protein